VRRVGGELVLWPRMPNAMRGRRVRCPDSLSVIAARVSRMIEEDERDKKKIRVEGDGKMTMLVPCGKKNSLEVVSYLKHQPPDEWLRALQSACSATPATGRA